MQINNMAEIYENNKGLITNEVKRFMYNGIEFEELMQIAYFGVDAAVSSFDKDMGIPFIGHLRLCVRRTLIKEINKLSPVKFSERMNYQVRMYFAIKAKLRRLLGYEPSAVEIAEDIGCSVAEVKKIENSDIRIDESLDSLREKRVPDDAYLEPGYDLFIDNDNKATFWSAAKSCLNEKQFEVIREYYINNRTIKDVGNILGIKPSTVQQILETSLARLKRDKAINNHWKLFKE